MALSMLWTWRTRHFYNLVFLRDFNNASSSWDEPIHLMDLESSVFCELKVVHFMDLESSTFYELKVVHFMDLESSTFCELKVVQFMDLETSILWTSWTFFHPF